MLRISCRREEYRLHCGQRYGCAEQMFRLRKNGFSISGASTAPPKWETHDRDLVALISPFGFGSQPTLTAPTGVTCTIRVNIKDPSMQIVEERVLLLTQISSFISKFGCGVTEQYGMDEASM